MKLGKLAHKLRLSSDSMVLLKKGSAIAEPKVITDLVSTIEKTNLSNIILLVVDDFDDIRIMDERQMNAHGWFRIETLRHITKVVPKEEVLVEESSDVDVGEDDLS